MFCILYKFWISFVFCLLHLEAVLLAHVLDGQPAHPPDPFHVLLLLPDVQPDDDAGHPGHGHGHNDGDEVEDLSHLDVQPFLQPSQVSALRKLGVRKFLRVVCRWVHNQVHLREDFNYQCSGKNLKRCHLSKRVQGFDEDRLNVSWTGVVAGGEVDLVLPVQGAGEKVLKRWIISSKAGNRICNGAETWRRYTTRIFTASANVDIKSKSSYCGWIEVILLLCWYCNPWLQRIIILIIFSFDQGRAVRQGQSWGFCEFPKRRRRVLILS